MTYDPKNRPVFLGTEQDRTNPNRLTQGVMSVADQNENQIPVVEKPPTILQKALAIGKVIALVLASLAGTVVALNASGAVVMPAWLMGLATAITALAAALGIASPGLKAKDAGAGPLKDLPPEQ